MCALYRHDNAGPKFGIQLLGSGVRATNHLNAGGNTRRELICYTYLRPGMDVSWK